MFNLTHIPANIGLSQIMLSWGNCPLRINRCIQRPFLVGPSLSRPKMQRSVKTPLNGPKFFGTQFCSKYGHRQTQKKYFSGLSEMLKYKMSILLLNLGGRL